MDMRAKGCQRIPRGDRWKNELVPRAGEGAGRGEDMGRAFGREGGPGQQRALRVHPGGRKRGGRSQCGRDRGGQDRP